jgi:cell wall-associated NlpC family hydrolase
VDFEAVRAGDLLFFSDRDDRHVTHVAVVLEADRLVHSALGRGGVSVELLTGDDAYVRRLLSQRVAARRIV